MSIPINVWAYNDIISSWILKSTEHYQETFDEKKYFRVLNHGKKSFYFSVNDYLKHNEESIVLDSDITDVSGKVLMKFVNESDNN